VTEVRTEPVALLLPLAVDSVLIAGLLLAAVGPADAPASPILRTDTTPNSTLNASGTELTVDPPSYLMRTGANLTVEAVWSANSPLCRMVPLWYYWSVDGGTATGFLNATAGPSATFTADSFGTGTATVAVRSGAVLDCGASETVLERTSEANVSIVVPLLLSGVELGPNPLVPGGTANLEGTVTGGEPPYELDVTWGDGDHSTVGLPTPGPFSVAHRFSAGEFVPSVVASDADGGFVEDQVPETLSVETGAEVAITPASYVAELGVPAEFTGIADNEPTGAVTLFDCSNATVGPSVTSPTIPNGTEFSCTFTTPGTAEVLFGVYPPQPGGPAASVVLYEEVVAPPQISAELAEPVAEVGETELVRVCLSGGALPVSLVWNLSGNRSSGTETVDSDGGGVVALPLGVAGEYTVGIRASDALGSVETNSSAVVRVESPLAANASGARSLTSYGAVARVAGEVLSGCPPFFWWVVPDLASANVSVENGTLPNVGVFAWSGWYAREGNLSVLVGMTDGCGATWQTGLGVPLVTPLSVEAAVTPGPTSPNETLSVNVSIAGGQPPFQLVVNASDNESWNRTVISDGTYRWLLLTDGNGSVGVTVSVTDLLDGWAETNLTVVLTRPSDQTSSSPTPSPPPPVVSGPNGNSTEQSANDPTWILVVFIPVGVAATFALLWRRRSRKSPEEVPGPDPVATLKRIIEPAEGAERFTVELLAEEAGIPLTVVRTTIDRLVSEGTVRSEGGADGEEVLSWSSDAGR
jgi:hypothetical protein